MLSIIIPAYNEDGNVINTMSVVSSVMEENKILFEVLFINDGSSDNTWDKLCEVAQIYDNVVAINFSRNFGKESAIFAGLKYAKGDACVVMDCDLQHPVEKIVEMYRIWENNDVDIVEARKTHRGKENIFHTVFAKLFYSIIKSSSGLEMRGASDFKLMDRKVVDALNNMPERLTFFRAMSSWVGFKTEKVYFEVADRTVGESKWSIKSLIRYAISSITSFSSIPMQLVTIFGFILFMTSVVLGANTLFNKIVGRSEEGFPTVILLQLFTSSIIMFSLGIIGYYLSQIYEEIKNRPRFIVGDIKRSTKEIEESQNEK